MALAHLTFTQRSIHAALTSKVSFSNTFRTDSATPRKFGELLVVRRKETRLTQKQLALATQIPRKQLGRWVGGRALPSQKDLSRVAQILKLPESAIRQLRWNGELHLVADLHLRDANVPAGDDLPRAQHEGERFITIHGAVEFLPSMKHPV